MTHYFEVQRNRAVNREQEISYDFDVGNARAKSHFMEEPNTMDTENQNTMFDPSQLK
jgi:hypothetical protein